MKSARYCIAALLTLPAMPPSLRAVSWSRMSDAVENVRRRLLRAASALGAAGVPYAVVGGNAVAAWVSRVDEAAVRNTHDVNILLRREDLSAAAEALKGRRFPSSPNGLSRSRGSHGRISGWRRRPGGGCCAYRLCGRETRADQPEANARIDESEDAGGFRLVGLDARVAMKVSAFRDKDRVHLRDLISAGLVDPSWLTRLSKTLRPRLQQILSTPEE